MKKTFN
jgi:hypothetical protein